MKKWTLESGYWVFHAPVGYRYVQARSGGGKVLVHDEQLAQVVRDALEGFATGRFSSQAEVARFLESNPLFPERCKKSGSVRLMTVSRMLKKGSVCRLCRGSKMGNWAAQGEP